MDANQNGSASAGDVQEAAGASESAVAVVDDEAAAPSENPPAEQAPSEPASADDAPEPAAEDVPQPRGAESEPAATASAESGSGKSAKKRKSAPKAKAAGTKSLVVFREGKVHYADESVVVLDLNDAAHPDTDVHDVVDKLSELRDAAESPGRVEAVTLVAELIQAKALA